MKILGAIIAGGKARRFGSDKAMALIDGRPMLDHVISALNAQVDRIVICGREWPGLQMLRDQPEGGIGPLAGLNAALDFACAHGFDAVVSLPVDVVPLPDDLVARLAGPEAAVFTEQHLIGWWPAGLAQLLHDHVAAGHRSLRSWIEASHARAVAEPAGLINVNRPADLP